MLAVRGRRRAGDRELHASGVQASEQLVRTAMRDELRSVEGAVRRLFLVRERIALGAGQRATEKARKDVLVLQPVEGLERRLVHREPEPRRERPERLEVKPNVVDERPVEIKDSATRSRSLTPVGDTRP